MSTHPTGRHASHTRTPKNYPRGYTPETRDPQGRVLSFVDESSVEPLLGNRSLKVTATLGENTGGGLLWTWPEKMPSPVLPEPPSSL